MLLKKNVDLVWEIAHAQPCPPARRRNGKMVASPLLTPQTMCNLRCIYRVLVVFVAGLSTNSFVGAVETATQALVIMRSILFLVAGCALLRQTVGQVSSSPTSTINNAQTLIPTSSPINYVNTPSPTGAHTLAPSADLSTANVAPSLTMS